MFEYLSTGPVVDLTTVPASNFSLSSLSNNRLLTMWSTFVDGVGTTFWAQILDTNGQPLSAAISVTGPSLYGAPTPVVTELSDGRFVVAWQQGDFSTTAVHAQIYSASGTPLGAEIVVPGPAGGRQYWPGITATSDGGFVVGWNTTSLSPGGNILVQRFDASGAATGSNVQINTAVSGGQILGDMDALPNGSFVATWSVNGDVHARVVDASGALLGSEITVNTATAGGQGSAHVEVLSGGRFVIVWVTDDPARDGSGTAVLAQVFEANGTPVGAEILVNTVTVGNQGNPSIAALADGTFVISWANETSANSASYYGPSSIRAQVFDASGVRQGSEIVVQSNTSSVEVRPNAVALANGGFSVGWIEYSGIGVALTTRSELRTFAPVSVQQIAAGASTLSLDENRTIVGTLALTDGNGQPLSYVITGGADAARFTIDNATGALLFVAAPNFEAPTDSGANNVYDLVITVSGAQGSSNQAIAVTVANVNEAPVITSNGGGSTASVSRSENGTAVTTVQASDQDGNTVTYSIVGGADAARFTINSSTGALSFVSAPNYEAPTDVGANNVYDVIVQASDGTLSDTQAIAVTVTNVNEPLALTNNGGGATATIALTENTQAVTTLTASDPENGTITYYIAGGVDSARFTINAQTGALQFVSSPNFEAPADADLNNTYLVTVGATDGLNWDYQDLTITVSNVNEAPVITSGGGGDTASGTFNETSTSTVYVVTSTDPEGTARIYSIAGGADAARFTINSSTGQLRFVTSPNYEAPTDADGNNVYEVVVRASDGTLSDTQALSIAINNLNEAPVFTSNGGGTSASITLVENGSTVTTVAATDPDGLAVTYAISGGLDAALFTIDTQTGLLRFINAPNFESPTDNGANNVYNVNVRASDASGVGTTQTIAVTVTNVNEAPVFSSPGSFSISENGTAAGAIVATDPEGSARTFSIVGGADAALFTIDAATGALSFVSAPNYEAPADADGDNAYQVTVQASDGTLAAAQAVTVTVGNVNETPVITSNGAGASAAIGVAENGSAVTTVTSTDPEGTARTYAISGGADAALFTIDAATGVLSFVAAPNYEAPADSDGDNVYQVTVSASDGSLVDTQALAVTVSNVNEAPTIVSATALTAAENGTAAGTVAGTDPDGTAPTYSIVGGADAALFAIDSATGALSFVAAPNYEAPSDANGDNAYEVTVQASDGSLSATQAVTVTVGNVNEGPAFTSPANLSLAENGTAAGIVAASDPDGTALTYSISGGTDAALFTIDAATGALSFASAPNYEAPADAGADNVYDVIVSASDGLLSATQAIAVAIGNANEGQTMATGTTFGVNENTTGAGALTATDLDGDALTYAISGGLDAARFTINAATGAISFVTAPNFEAPTDSNGDNLYELVITASDGSISTNASYFVQVGDANEAPVITGSTSLAASEGSTAVATLTSTDPENNPRTWSISGGLDAARFVINAATGALSFAATPDYEAPADSNGDNVYLVQVTVSDGSLSSSQLFTVNLGNVNEAPIITSNGGGTSAAISVGENSASVATVTSTDPEGTARTYSIIGGADAARFTINAATGALAFIAPPNYEAPTDVGGNNVYDVIVAASDGFLSDTQALAITVTNVNEAPVITSNGGGDTAAVTVNENTTAVTTLTSTDAEGAARTYSIAGGADAARFTINPTTGALSFVAAPNWEAPTDSNGDNVYNVVVAASDGTLTDTQSLAVTVGNVVDGSTINGTNSANTLTGTTAEDTINGLGGNDTITGGLGADVLTGGSGADRFVYSALNHSSLSAPDRITDFSLSQNDRISLSAIDANSGLAGDQAFSWIGTGNFTNVAGQLRYYQQNGHTYVTGDVNGDGVGDFLIQLDPAVTLSASYFIL